MFQLGNKYIQVLVIFLLGLMLGYFIKLVDYNNLEEATITEDLIYSINILDMNEQNISISNRMLGYAIITNIEMIGLSNYNLPKHKERICENWNKHLLKQLKSINSESMHKSIEKQAFKIGMNKILHLCKQENRGLVNVIVSNPNLK